MFYFMRVLSSLGVGSELFVSDRAQLIIGSV